jgi:hypothetical protein
VLVPASAAATGVSNVKCSTIAFFFCGSVPSIQSSDCPSTASTSWRGWLIATSGLLGIGVAPFDRAPTRFSHGAKTAACAAGGDGGTRVLTFNVQTTLPGLL